MALAGRTWVMQTILRGWQFHPKIDVEHQLLDNVAPLS
jgi:hypothetical protein